MNNWFPFFSMLFWFTTKVAALGMFFATYVGLTTMFAVGFTVSHLMFGVLLPGAVGFFLLTTEILFDLGTAEQRRRQAVSK